MEFHHPPADTDGEPPIRLQWFREAVAECRYDFDQIQTAVQISYSADPTPASESEFAFTENAGNVSAVTFKNDLYDENRPGNEGGAAPGTWAGKAFFMEVVIHELAHVVMGSLFTPTWKDNICGLFGRDGDDWSPPAAPWRRRVVEAAAETFKDLFTHSDNRKFLNRTDFILPERNMHDFVSYFTVWNPVDSPHEGDPPGPHAGLLPVPPDQVVRTEFSVDWSGLVVVTTTVKIPEMIDGDGNYHPPYDSIETHTLGGAGVNEPILTELYPAYITHPPPEPFFNYHPPASGPPGAGRPRYGDEDPPPEPYQAKPKVAAEIGTYDDKNSGMAVTVGYALPGHQGRHFLDGAAEDGLPQGFLCQYPEQIPPENPTPTAPPDDLMTGVKGSSARSYEVLVTPVAPVLMEEGDQSPYPDSTGYKYRFIFAWPTARSGGGTSLAGDPLAVEWGWIYPVQADPYADPVHDPDPVRGRGTVIGFWVQNEFQFNVPIYPYTFPPLPDLKLNPPARGNVRYEEAQVTGVAAGVARVGRKVAGRALKVMKLG